MPPLAYTRLGAGPALLLVHGLGSAATTWRPLLPRLAERYDVVAVDLPGHGGSAPLPPGEPATPGRLARAVGALLDDLGWDRAHLLGNSLGGWVGLELAADGRARSLTALAPAGLWLRPSHRRNPVVRSNRAAARATRAVQPALLRSRVVRQLAFASVSAWPGRVPYDVALEAARAQADATGYEAALDGTLGLRFDRAAEISSAVPVTAVWGDRDHVLPARSTQERSLLPEHAAWVVLPHCGHAPQWDAPGAVVRLLDRTTAAG